MVKVSRLVVAAGALALSLTTGAGLAAADPDLSSAINTTCSYSQAMAALRAQAPDAANELSASPLAQAWVRSFLASPPGQRQQMVQQANNIPAAQQYLGLAVQIANTCGNY